MTIQSTPLNSITLVETPTMVGDRFIDGHLKGQPVVIQRLSNGMFKPCKGAKLHLPYGTAKVVGYTPDNRLHVKIVKYNDDFESISADGYDIYCAEEYVAKASTCRNVGIEQDRRRFTELYKSDITDRLSPTNADKMERMYPLLAVDELVIELSNYPLSGDTMVHVTVIPTEKERKAQAENRRALEVAAALELRRKLLEKYNDDVVPDEVSADIADAFGDGE